MIILKSPLFHDKVRYFNTHDRLKQFLDARVPKLATSNRLSEQDVYAQMNITEVDSLNIGSSADYPSGQLSNFAVHVFVLDGVICTAMEGFLQALKINDTNRQRQICVLTGRDAKRAVTPNHWKDDHVLHWQGVAYLRDSDAYQQLLTRAFDALNTNGGFRQALADTGDQLLTHSMGRTKTNQTVLTADEFMSQLNRLRDLNKKTAQ